MVVQANLPLLVVLVVAVEQALLELIQAVVLLVQKLEVQEVLVVLSMQIL
jgi:hypothetical protein